MIIIGYKFRSGIISINYFIFMLQTLSKQLPSPSLSTYRIQRGIGNCTLQAVIRSNCAQNYRADRHSNTRHYPRYDYKESYYFQRHRSRDRTRRNSHRDSHRTRSPGASHTRHERRYSRDYRRSPTTRRAPSVRAESRVDSRYADHHDSEGHVLVNLGGDLTPRCKSRAWEHSQHI